MPQTIRGLRQRVRIALKEIESLSSNMELAEDLHKLGKDLQSLQAKYSEGLPKDQGLFIRPKATGGAERVLKLKRKYKRLTQKISHYKSIPTRQVRRPRLDNCYHRVGKNATTKRKVNLPYY